MMSLPSSDSDLVPAEANVPTAAESIFEPPEEGGDVQRRQVEELDQLGADRIFEDELWVDDVDVLPFVDAPAREGALEQGPPAAILRRPAAQSPWGQRRSTQPPRESQRSLGEPIKQQLRSLLQRLQRQPPAAPAELHRSPCGAPHLQRQPSAPQPQGPSPAPSKWAPHGRSEQQGRASCEAAQGPACAPQDVLSLRQVLRYLEGLGDTSRIITVRGVRRLGADTAAQLQEHFARRCCCVEAVLTYVVRKAPSAKVRAGELAFVVLASAADARTVLDGGLPHHLNGQALQVVAFDNGGA